MRCFAKLCEKAIDKADAQEDPPPLITPQVKQSCVSVVQQKKVLKKYGFNISVSEGKQTLKVPSDEKANPLWEDFVNTRFLETEPHAAGVLDRLLPETIACINFEISKIAVEFSYPLLPSRCDGCGMWGHLQANCGKKDNRKEEEQKQVIVEKEEKKKLPKSAQKHLKGKDSEQVTTKQKSKQVVEVEEGQIVEEWLTPGKVGGNSEFTVWRSSDHNSFKIFST
ncbi:hypothetical protein Bca101_020343 [Brassica carinata]